MTEREPQFTLLYESAVPHWIAVHQPSDCYGVGDNPLAALYDLSTAMADLKAGLEGHLLGSHLRGVQMRLNAPTAQAFIHTMSEAAHQADQHGAEDL